MSRAVAVPDFGAGDSLWQYVTVAEPGEPGYPTPGLPLDDPWVAAVNQAIREVQASAGRGRGHRRRHRARWLAAGAAARSRHRRRRARGGLRWAASSPASRPRLPAPPEMTSWPRSTRPSASSRRSATTPSRTTRGDSTPPTPGSGMSWRRCPPGCGPMTRHWPRGTCCASTAASSPPPGSATTTCPARPERLSWKPDDGRNPGCGPVRTRSSGGSSSTARPAPICAAMVTAARSPWPSLTTRSWSPRAGGSPAAVTTGRPRRTCSRSPASRP